MLRHRLTGYSRLSGSLVIRYLVFSGCRPIFGQTWPQNPFRTTGLVLQCRLHQKSAPQTNSKAISWRQNNPARLPSGTQLFEQPREVNSDVIHRLRHDEAALISGTAGEHKNCFFRMAQEGPPGRSPTPKMALDPIPEGKNPGNFEPNPFKGPGADLGHKTAQNNKQLRSAGPGPREL